MKSTLLRALFVICAIVALYAVSPQMTAPAMADQGGLLTSKIEPALLQAMQANPKGEFAVIVQTAMPGKGKPPARLNSARAKGAFDRIKANNGKHVNSLAIVGGASATMNVDGISKLSRDPFISFIRADRRLKVLGTPAASSLYTQLVNAPDVWAQGINGQGITVAVVDSGITPVDDVSLPAWRIVAAVDFSSNLASGDPGGHGTHVAGIIGGNGTDSDQARMGIAPGANLVDVRVIGPDGTTTASSVIRGIEWVVQNRKTYNIRVMNLSLGGATPVSYRNDPLAAAVEVAWNSGIVVVAAAGNGGSNAGTIDAPGSDPFVLTVGALDDHGTLDTWDDTIATFSGRGPTLDGISKPDLLAPGRRIVSLRVPGSYLDVTYPDRVVDRNYFRLSGTSMSAPVVAGTAALVLQKNPALTPDQIKDILMQSARPVAGGDANSAGHGLVDALAAVNSSVTSAANQGLRPSDEFCKAMYSALYGIPLSSLWTDPTYQGIDWSNITWDNITWDNITWDNITWDNITWDNITWDNITWDNITWDNITWDASGPSGGWTTLSKLN